MRRDYRIEKEPTVVIIPMIDIMLFLLVFFMISTIYMVQANTLPVNLPAAADLPLLLGGGRGAPRDTPAHRGHHGAGVRNDSVRAGCGAAAGALSPCPSGLSQ